MPVVSQSIDKADGARGRDSPRPARCGSRAWPSESASSQSRGRRYDRPGAARPSAERGAVESSHSPLSRRVSRAPVVAHDAEHVRGVRAVRRRRRPAPWPSPRRWHRSAGHQRGNRRAAERPALVGVVAKAGYHQEAAEIGEAQAQRAVLVGELRDFLGGNCAMVTEISSTIAPKRQAWANASHRSCAVAASRKASRLSEARLQAVSSRNMYSEQGFEARIDPPRGAGVPVVDGGVELDAGIGAGPGRLGDLFHKPARLHGLHRLAAHARLQLPIAVLFRRRCRKASLDADGVVGVLARRPCGRPRPPNRCRSPGTDVLKPCRANWTTRWM